MAKASGSSAAVRRAFERACALYDEFATTLTGIIMRLRAQDDANSALERRELDLIKAHQKAVLMVLDFEAQLLKRRIGAAADGEIRIDLDAARAEIARRIARIESAQRA